MLAYIRFWLIFPFVFVLDQWSKSLVVGKAIELRNHPVIVLDLLDGPENFLEFTYITNPGAAWSMLSDYPEFLTLLAIAALFSIFFFRKTLELEKFQHQFVFGLLVGGITGNLADRLFRNPAEVVDFIDFYLPLINYDYPVFNIADSAIFVGALSYLAIGIVDARKETSLVENQENTG